MSARRFADSEHLCAPNFRQGLAWGEIKPTDMLYCTAAAVVGFLGAWGVKRGGAVLRERRGTFNSRWEVRLVGFWVTESVKVTSPSLASARRLRATSEIETVLHQAAKASS